MASAREITNILNDQRMISLEEIIKQNSLLPPISDLANNGLRQ